MATGTAELASDGIQPKLVAYNKVN